MTTTSDHQPCRRLRCVVVFLALLPCVASATEVLADLRALIDQTPELSQAFSQADIYAASPARAEAVAPVGGNRHAVVLFKKTAASNGQMFCHAALGRQERDAWMVRLVQAAGGDAALANQLAKEHPARIRFKKAEYSTLRFWRGWTAAVCVAPKRNITIVDQPPPSARSVREAAYALGKELFTSGKKKEALDRFKSLKRHPDLYTDALLYVVAILQETHPDIAKRLREEHLDLARANDPDALQVFIRSSRQIGFAEDVERGRQRCSQLGRSCAQSEEEKKVLVPTVQDLSNRFTRQPS